MLDLKTLKREAAEYIMDDGDDIAPRDSHDKSFLSGIFAAIDYLAANGHITRADLVAPQQERVDIEALRQECHLHLANKIENDFGSEDAKIGASAGINVTIDHLAKSGRLSASGEN